MYKNRIKVEFLSLSENERFARVTASAFVLGLNPTMEEIDDLRTAVSEAVTNAIVHGYEKELGIVTMECELNDRELTVTVRDNGKGIEDVEKARTPMFTTKPDEDRAGMGFMFMDIFMDKVDVESEVGVGTTVVMKKVFEDGNC